MHTGRVAVSQRARRNVAGDQGAGADKGVLADSHAGQQDAATTDLGSGALRDLGFWIGVAGNQTERTAGLLRELALPADYVATSGEWGVAKPAKAFFDRVV